MSDRPTQVSRDDIDAFVGKLQTFYNESLDPRERVVMTYILDQARAATTGDVQGFEGGQGGGDLHDFSWLQTIQIQATTPQPFNVDEHRLGGNQSNR